MTLTQQIYDWSGFDLLADFPGSEPGEAGWEVRPVLPALAQWGDKWVRDRPVSAFSHSCGQELEIGQSCHHCGAALTAGSPLAGRGVTAMAQVTGGLIVSGQNKI